MSAPAPVPGHTPVTPPTALKGDASPLILPNGFRLAKNGQSASKDIKDSSGEQFTLTVFFPAGISKDDKKRSLSGFSEKYVESMVKQAKALGLGKTSKKADKGTIESISFRHDDKGQHSEAVKNYSGGKRKVLTKDYYTDKAKQSVTSEKLEKRGKKEAALKEAFIIIQKIWGKTTSPAPAPAAPPLAPPPADV